jgi:lipopolysaccharide transport system ATP-binding protein
MTTTRGYVEFDGVWKKFRRGQLHDSLRDLIPALGRRLVGRGPDRSQLDQGDFWAVRDVSFQVTPGEALGIIGPNGAGKSTILKLLSGILRPNRGSYRVQGRIGALIEVAAGFHPDLTGRENVFLQGSIMGMRKNEIEARFDEIVDFAGLPEFIDTQVKRYSSGMNARLGFSIAAHLSPDVLLVDEVLAVGDYAFQKRAFERISAMVRRDIPVVIVSHQLDRIAQLCTKAILLEKGEVRFRGTAAETIASYVGTRESAAQGDADSTSPVRIASFTVSAAEAMASGDRLTFEISCHSEGVRRSPLQMTDLAVGVRVVAAQTGELIFASGTERWGLDLPEHGPFIVEGELRMNVPGGVYLLETLVWDRKRTQQVVAGPATYIRVEDEHSFHGKVNLQAAMGLRPHQLADVGP